MTLTKSLPAFVSSQTGRLGRIFDTPSRTNPISTNPAITLG
jgi:hypothetical protein